jgi:hypothetical protein
MRQGHGALLTLGQQREADVVGLNAFQRLAGDPGVVVLTGRTVVLAAPGHCAVGQHIAGITGDDILERPVREGVVHQQFVARLRDRERHRAIDRPLAPTRPRSPSLGRQCILLARWHRRSPGSGSRAGSGRPACGRSAGTWRTSPSGRRSACSAYWRLVLRRDREQRLVVLVRIDRVLALIGRVLDARGRAQPFAGILGNACRPCCRPSRRRRR